VLAGAAFGLMTGVLGPLGAALTRLPAGSEHPGRTAGPAFEMYYLMGNFVPWREAAWAVLAERVAARASRSGRLGQPDRGLVLPASASAALAAAAGRAADIAASLSAHVPVALQPAR
jgi:hypothetical protein